MSFESNQETHLFQNLRRTTVKQSMDEYHSFEEAKQRMKYQSKLFCSFSSFFFFSRKTENLKFYTGSSVTGEILHAIYLNPVTAATTNNLDIHIRAVSEEGSLEIHLLQELKRKEDNNPEGLTPSPVRSSRRM